MIFEVSVYDGKYTVRQNDDGTVDVLRYGERWRDQVTDKVLLALASEVDEQCKLIAGMRVGRAAQWKMCPTWRDGCRCDPVFSCQAEPANVSRR